MKSAITIIEKIASNILIALYQPFWFAVISSVLILFFYMFCYDPQGVGKGWKIAVKARPLGVRYSKAGIKVL